MRSALWDTTTGLASFHLHLDEIRGLLDNRRTLLLLHVTCGELGLVEAIYGWQVLDRVLRRTAELVESLRGSALSHRAVLAMNGVAGEEILVFEPGASDDAEVGPEQAALIAAAIESVLEDGFNDAGFSSMTPHLAFRVGFAMLEDNPHYRFERIVYRAVEQARSLEARREERRQAEWGSELRRIIQEQAFVTLYQPVVRLDTLEVFGHEVFSGGPDGGPLREPGFLFAMSERFGASRELDRLCRFAALNGPGEQGPGHGKVFLNTRPGNLSDPEWGGSRLLECLASHGLTRSDVVVEFPESGVPEPRFYRGAPAELRDLELVREASGVLRDHGFGIALDDVGTGRSSLEVIESVRPDYLKIDRSLVGGLDRNLLKQDVVASLLQIATKVGAEVIAVGIETRAELEALRSMGATLGQGFLFGRPSPTPHQGRLAIGSIA